MCRLVIGSSSRYSRLRAGGVGTTSGGRTQGVVETGTGAGVGGAATGEATGACRAQPVRMTREHKMAEITPVRLRMFSPIPLYSFHSRSGRDVPRGKNLESGGEGPELK